MAGKESKSAKPGPDGSGEASPVKETLEPYSPRNKTPDSHTAEVGGTVEVYYFPPHGKPATRLKGKLIDYILPEHVDHPEIVRLRNRGVIS